MHTWSIWLWKNNVIKTYCWIEKAQSGEIFLNDDVVSSTKQHLKTEKRKVGFLFQDYALFPHLTVKENLNFAIQKKKL